MISSRRVLATLVVLTGSLLVLPSAVAQDEGKGEKVRFPTVDGVEIQGRFYAGAKRNAATVMMLHALGEDSRKTAWAALAETLNKEGYSVLTFDFRGHKDSKKLVDPALF